MALAGMIINIGLNLILIPKYEVIGSAFAGMLTQIFTAATQLLIATRVFKFKINYKLIASLLIFVIVTFLSSYFLSLQDFHWLITVAAVGVIALVASFFTGLFRVKEAFTILKQRNAE
jgi:O-antigen/teichoic acid export membrane protein